MTEFSTQPPENAYGEASRNYLDNVIRVDHGSEIQDHDVQFGDRYVVDHSQVATYRNLRQMNEAVTSGEAESPKQQLYLTSVQSEMAMRETYSSSIPLETITRAFDGVEADTDRAGLLANVAYDIQREVRAEARQAAADGDTARAAELTQSRNDLNTYVGVKNDESIGQKKIFDRNVRNDWLDGRDGDSDFYDTTYSMQEIAAMDRVEAKYLPDILERIAYKRETEAMKQQVARLNVRTAAKTEEVGTDAGTAEQPLSHVERIEKIRDEEMQRIYSDPEEVANAVADAQENLRENWLAKARENYSASPSEQTEKVVKRFERESEQLGILQEFADQWQGEKRRDIATVDFATYMKDIHASAETEFHSALDAAGGRLPAENEKGIAFGRIDKAYRAIFDRKGMSSVNARVMRRSAQTAHERIKP